MTRDVNPDGRLLLELELHNRRQVAELRNDRILKVVSQRI